ncbi:MAG: hypothetical protein EOP11_18830, partial [Proteobacteria bacterium]
MRTRILLASLLLLPTSAFAISTKPIELGTAAPAASVTIEEEEGATLIFRLPGGKEQREENIGQEFANFTLGTKADATVEALDLDGDGQQEIIARTVLPGGEGAVYVFRFDREKSRFVSIQGDDGDDFLYVSAKADVSVDAAGVIFVKAAKAGTTYVVKADRFTVKPAPA